MSKSRVLIVDDEADIRELLAMTLARMGVESHGAATREEEMEDLVSVVGQTFLGLTLNCARCHAHKFDPVPQEDYYRLQAVFAALDRTDRPYHRDPALHASRRALEDAVLLLEVEDGTRRDRHDQFPFE